MKSQTKKKRNTKKRQQQKTIQIEIIVVVLFVILLVAILGEFGLTMIVGDILSFAFKYLFGFFRFIMYGIFVYTLYFLFRYKKFFDLNVKFFGVIIILVSLLLLVTIPGYIQSATFQEAFTSFSEHISLTSPNSLLDAGGIFGVSMYGLCKQYIGLAGVIILAGILLLIGFAMYLGKTLYEMIHPPVEITRTGIENVKQSIAQSIQERKAKKIYDVEAFYDDEDEDNTDYFDETDEDEYEDDEIATDFNTDTTYQIEPEIYEQYDADEYLPSVDYDDTTESYSDADYFEPASTYLDNPASHDSSVEEIPDEQVDIAFTADSVATTPKKLKPLYRLPSLNFLTKPDASNKQGLSTDRTIQKRLLQETLDNFGVKATVSSVQVGPAVTQYEVTLAPGVKVSRIVNLSTDISLALAAKGVRIEAPIPGKAAVGIEVPNDTVQMVTLYEALRKGYQDKTRKLLVGLGRTINGDEVQIEINKMPHLLVAGATGSGKSVCVNTIIMSILLRATPDEVKFLMIDPKKVELNVYNDIPHLLAPVVTNPKKAAVALRKVVAIMDERYEIFADAFVRNMEGYNDYARKNDLEEMPYIVVIIDELSDLMVVASKEVEESIMRLAQMARAAGIHMIVATQRPSVDVITGVIKSNIPSRIAFAVSSQVDSRTILDGSGAEKLVGKGDMLYLSAGENKPLRVQGAYVSEEEIEKVVEFVKNQQETTYDQTLLEVATQSEDFTANELFPETTEVDELFEEAVQFAISIEMISTSKLQRRFRMGFNRAARIMDEMIERGILGQSEGNKGRKVLIKDISELATLSKDSDIESNENIEDLPDY